MKWIFAAAGLFLLLAPVVQDFAVNNVPYITETIIPFLGIGLIILAVAMD